MTLPRPDPAVLEWLERPGQMPHEIDDYKNGWRKDEDGWSWTIGAFDIRDDNACHETTANQCALWDSISCARLRRLNDGHVE